MSRGRRLALAGGALLALSLSALGVRYALVRHENRAYRPRAVGSLPGPYRIIDVHEHIGSRSDLPRLLRVMDEQSIARAVLVASSRQTLGGGVGFVGHEENNAVVVAMAARLPERLTAFVTIDPGDPRKLERLRAWLARGARGLKLYSGHGSFRGAPLDDPAMLPVYEHCEREGVPMVFHVNMGKFGDEFRRVLARFPRLRVDCPHFCMSTIRLDRLDEILGAHPSLYVDVSLGAESIVAEGLPRIAQKADRVRAIVLRHTDRFLFGADLVVAGATPTLAAMRDAFASYRGLLERERYHAASLDKDLRGLALPAEALRKIYQENPRRFLGMR
ncbi:MAG: amidohydrolase family protein [Myxococcota bacterium]